MPSSCRPEVLAHAILKLDRGSYQEIQNLVRGVAHAPLYHHDGRVVVDIFPHLLAATELIVGVLLTRGQIWKLAPAKDILREELTATEMSSVIR